MPSSQKTAPIRSFTSASTHQGQGTGEQTSQVIEVFEGNNQRSYAQLPSGLVSSQIHHVIRNKIPKILPKNTTRNSRMAAQKWMMTTQIHDQEANSLPVKQVDGTQQTFFSERFTDLQRVKMLEKQRKTKSSREPRFPRRTGHWCTQSQNRRMAPDTCKRGLRPAKPRRWPFPLALDLAPFLNN